jgi:hypothetical protein
MKMSILSVFSVPRPSEYFSCSGSYFNKEGKQATHWTRLSCHRFRANEVRLQLSLLAYNPWQPGYRAYFTRRPPVFTSRCSKLVSDQLSILFGSTWGATRLLLAKNHLTRRQFGTMLRRVWALRVQTG